MQPEQVSFSSLEEEPQTPTERTNPGYFLVPSGSDNDYFVFKDSSPQGTDI